MFAQVCEEAATLILAGAHLVDFVDLNVSEVVLFHYAERAPVVVVLKNVSDGARGVSVRMQRRNVMKYISGGCRGTPGVCMVDLGKKEYVGGSEFIVYIP